MHRGIFRKKPLHLTENCYIQHVSTRSLTVHHWRTKRSVINSKKFDIWFPTGKERWYGLGTFIREKSFDMSTLMWVSDTTFLSTSSERRSSTLCSVDFCQFWNIFLYIYRSLDLSRSRSENRYTLHSLHKVHLAPLKVNQFQKQIFLFSF